MYAIDIMNTTTEAGTVKTTKLFWFFGGIVCLIALGEHIYIRLIHEKYGTGKQLISREKLSSRIDFFKKFWGPFVVYVIATSIILLFIASFTLDKVITLTTMNEWVSMVLGMVALIIGVISLYLSYLTLIKQINHKMKCWVR